MDGPFTNDYTEWGLGSQGSMDGPFTNDYTEWGLGSQGSMDPLPMTTLSGD